MKDEFSGVFGQAHAKDTLRKMCLSGRIPHALLFSGPDGVGKHFTAIRFAQLLNLNNCKSPFAVKKVGELQEPYIKIVQPLPRGKNETSDSSPIEKFTPDMIQHLQDEMAKKSENPYYKVRLTDSNTIKVNSIRDLRKYISLSFDELKYRIILIQDAHLMNDESQNTLLKSLEEPPEGIIFILCTAHKEKLLETIHSRCWTVNFEPLSTSDVESILIEHFSADAKLAGKIAPFSNGSVTYALDLMKYNFEELQTRTINILRYSLALKYHSALKEMSSVLEDSTGESLRLIINLITFWISDLYRDKYQQGKYYFEDHKDSIVKFNQRFKSDMLSVSDRLDKLISTIDNNVNLNLIGLSVIFELASLRYSDA